MLTVCGECHQSYDDTFQLPECSGPGPSTLGDKPNHADFARSPLVEHVMHTQAANNRG